MTRAPLTGLRVLDFSQFLAGPYASLRLADLGAEVIKIERSGQGDLSRYLYVSDVLIDGESTIFHAINRGKKSVAVDLKTEAGKAQVWDLVDGADVVIQNFRPGVIERLGFGYDTVCARKPDIVYGSVSGYGTGHDWDGLPGQDLLAQARSGVMWLSGAAKDGPVAFGLPIADILAGAALAQGLLALLVRRGISGEGGHVETSLLEAMVDLQFELLTTHLNDGQRLPQRPAAHAAHAYLGAPYGVYETADGHVAIAMNDLEDLYDCLGMSSQHAARDPFADRDLIQSEIAAAVKTQTTAAFTKTADARDIWAAPVSDWRDLRQSGVLQTLGLIGETARGDTRFASLLSPLRVDGARLRAEGPAPYLGESCPKWESRNAR